MAMGCDSVTKSAARSIRSAAPCAASASCWRPSLCVVPTATGRVARRRMQHAPLRCCKLRAMIRLKTIVAAAASAHTSDVDGQVYHAMSHARVRYEVRGQTRAPCRRGNALPAYSLRQKLLPRACPSVCVCTARTNKRAGEPRSVPRRPPRVAAPARGWGGREGRRHNAPAERGCPKWTGGGVAGRRRGNARGRGETGAQPHHTAVSCACTCRLFFCAPW